MSRNLDRGTAPGLAIDSVADKPRNTRSQFGEDLASLTSAVTYAITTI